MLLVKDMQYVNSVGLLNKTTLTNKRKKRIHLATKEEFESFYNDFIKGSETFYSVEEFERTYRNNPKYKVFDCLNKKEYPLYHLTYKQTTWPEDIKKGLIKGVYVIREYNDKGLYKRLIAWIYVYDFEMYKEFIN